MKNVLSLLSFIILLCGCTENNSISNKLDEIEPLIKADPVAAQAKLDSISQSLLTDDELQARFILLNTYCLYRQEKEGKNDSLINIANHYYADHGTTHDKMLCNLLQGVILQNAEKYDIAINYLNQAATQAEDLQDHFMLGQIYWFMYFLCNHNRECDQTEYAERALQEYELYGDSAYILDSKISLGDVYLAQHEYVKAQKLLTECLKESKSKDDYFCIIKTLRSLSEAEVNLSMFNEALTHLSRIRQEYNMSFNSRDNALMATIFTHFNRKDSTLFYLNKSEESETCVYDQKFTLETSHEVHQAFGDFKTAYQDLCILKHLTDSTYQSRLRHTVSKEHRDYAIQQLRLSEHKVGTLIAAITFILVIALIAITFIQLKRRQQKAELLLQKEIVRHKEDELRLQAEELRHKEEELRLKRENAENVIRGMKQSEIYQRIKSKNSVLSKSDWKDLDNLFADMLPNFEVQLQRQNRLSETDWRICQLFKLDFTTTEIADLTSKATSTISTNCKRLCESHLNRDGGAKDWINYLHSL